MSIWKSQRVRSWGKYRYNRRFYHRSLILILLIASIPGLIIGLSIYWITTDNLETELQNLHQQQLKQRAASLDDQLSYLEMAFSNWSMDPKFDNRLTTLDFAYGYSQVQELYRTLLIMEGSHPLLGEVSLYVQGTKPLVFTKEQYTFLNNEKQIESYNNLLQSMKTMYWSSHIPDAPAVQLALVNKLSSTSMEPYGVLIARVNNEQLISMMRTLTPYQNGNTLLLTNDGNWALADHAGEFTPLEKELRQEVLQHKDSQGSFLINHDQEVYSVSYGELNRLGKSWTYISAAPLSSITAPVVSLSQRILLISASGLLIALVLSWLVSRRIYSPIERLAGMFNRSGSDVNLRTEGDELGMIEQQWRKLNSESELLRCKLKEQIPALREGFFLQFTQGYLNALHEQDLQERMKHYGWTIENHQFIVLMFQLTGFANLQGRFVIGDEELVTFSAANIIREVANQRYEQVEVINFHNFTVGMVLSFDAIHPTGWLDEELDEICQECMNEVNRLLKMQLTVSVSGWSHEAGHIPRLCSEAKQGLAYRDILDDNQVIRVERVNRSSPLTDSSYPFTTDKDILQAIRNGQEEEAAQLICRFIDELSVHGATEFTIQQGMMQLLGSIRYGVLQAGINPVQLFGNVNLFERLAAIREKEDMIIWFQQHIIRKFVQEMITRQDAHLKRMVENVVIHLQENYMTPLSLELCAELFGTSPYTLSRAFKQITGTNFIDYLTDTRIQHAKTLLQQTECRIHEVAEQVGYQHSYFNRIFKKYEGITPTRFREINRL